MDDFESINEVFFHSLNLRLPYNCKVKNFKIKTFFIYPKLINRKTLILYGDAEIITYYYIFFSNLGIKHYVNTQKINFIKKYKINLSNKIDLSSNITIKTLSPPKYNCNFYRCIFRTIRLRPCTLCNIKLSIPLKIDFDSNFKSEQNTDIYPIPTNTKTPNICEDISQISNTTTDIITEPTINNKSKDIDKNDSLTSNDSKDVDNAHIINTNNIIEPSINTRSTDIDKNASLTNNTTNDVDNAHLINANMAKDLSLKATIDTKPLNKTHKIESKLLIGRSSKDLFINKTLSLTDVSPLIWKIDEINTKVDIANIKIFTEKIYIDGFIRLTINYRNLVKKSGDFLIGNICFLTNSIPFSTFIDIDKPYSDNIKGIDYYKISEAFILDKLHKLDCEIESISDEALFSTIHLNLVLRLKVLLFKNTLLEVSSVKISKNKGIQKI